MAELKCSGATYNFSGPLDLVSLKATATNSDLTLYDGQHSGAYSGPGSLYGTFSPARSRRLVSSTATTCRTAGG